MPLSALEIFKLLPKTNCKKCGQPTCLAFAMQLAMKKVSLSQCPDVSAEAKAALESASAPPIRKVIVGSDEAAFSVGQETVLYRHDDKFYNPTGIALITKSSTPEERLGELFSQESKFEFERVGQKISINALAIIDDSGDASAFARAAGYLAEKSKLALILRSDSPDSLKAALDKCASCRPLLDGANAENLDAVAALAKEAKVPLAVIASDLEGLATLTERAKGQGIEDVILHLDIPEIGPRLENLARIRFLALKKTFRPLGYPTLVYCSDGGNNLVVAEAAACICKYASIVAVETFSAPSLLALLTVRMNIFTDPQKPVQVEPKLYPIGQPNENSPVLFTTNFSLTYYTVQADVEASRVPAYILCVDTEGTSVLTAYSGDKLNEKIVHDAMKKANLESVVKHRKLIIPGYVSQMSGALEEETGWEILVGPRESSVIPKYLREVWKGNGSD